MNGMSIIRVGTTPIQTYGRGRRCSACGARLSMYNPGVYCCLHSHLEPQLPVGGDMYYKACDECGEMKSGKTYSQDDAERDGLNTTCNPCLRRMRIELTHLGAVLAANPPGSMHWCLTCKKQYPADMAHFDYSKDVKSRLGHECHACRREREK